jgi:hypothetical protein
MLKLTAVDARPTIRHGVVRLGLRRRPAAHAPQGGEMQNRQSLQELTRILQQMMAGSFPDSPVSPWPELLHVAARTRTLPAIGGLLASPKLRGEGWRPPIWFEETARAWHDQVASRNKAASAATYVLAEALKASEVRFVFRKGVHVQAHYPSRGCRPFGDVDLLVHPADAPRAHSAVTAAGFEQKSLIRNQAVFLRLAARVLAEYHKEVDDIHVHVDMSDSILLPIFGRQGADLDVFARRSYICGLPVMGPVDLTLDLLMNLYATSTTLRYMQRLRYQRLVPYLDLLLVMGGFGDEQFNVLVDRADQWGILDAVSFGLGNLQRLFPRHNMHSACMQQEYDKTILDAIGQWELSSPVMWQVDIWDRMLLDDLPGYVPAPATPI